MPAHKRSTAEAVEGRRRSGRLSNTPKKSTYFESGDEESEDELSRPVKRARSSKKQPLAKQEPEDQYEEESEEEEPEAAKDEDSDEDDESVRPKVTIIPLEKMRDTGGVDYKEHKLHKNTMLFLRDLKANNRRPWLKSHDDEYRRAWKDWQSFVERTTLSIIDVDETVPELPAKDVVFRIYRDIRFSKDPTPYKPYFSAAWSRTGRKGPYAVYYVHCEPQKSLVAGGLWCPDKQHVDKLRRNIDRHPARWRAALNEPLFKKVFMPGIKAKEGPDAAVKRFIGFNSDTALKKRPLGYDISHPDIGLLRLRSYTVQTELDAAALCHDDAQEKLIETFQALSGLVSFLNSIVMPDPNLDEADDGDDNDDDDDEEGTS